MARRNEPVATGNMADWSERFDKIPCASILGTADAGLAQDFAVHCFQSAATSKEPVISRVTHGKFVEMASHDSSPIVRLYLASALGRLAFADRWAILEGLVSHAEDVEDNNLPRMYWFALEPMVPKHTDKALTLAVSGKIPKLQEFVANVN